MRRIDSASRSTIPFCVTLALLFTAFTSAATFGADGNGANSAYVYIGSFNGSNDSISGFAVASDGSAQSVPGSPFNLPSLSLVTAKNYLFGEDTQNIATYSPDANGTLRQTSIVNALSHCVGCRGQIIYALNPDRAGQTINAVISCGSCNSEVLPWSIGANGQLSFISGPTLPSGPAKWPGIITFTATDRFGYTPIAQSFGFLRHNPNGSLMWIYPGQVSAPPLNNGQQVCNINTVAASLQNYVTLAWYGGGPGCNAGGYVLGDYTVAQNGALQLVPDSGVTPQVYENAMAFDATGTYLAIAGAAGPNPNNTGGVEVLKLQSDGILAAVGRPLLLSGAPQFQYVGWDNAGHIYAVTEDCYQGCGNPDVYGLYIFNFDGQNLTLAPGSPYPIANTVSLAIVPQS